MHSAHPAVFAGRIIPRAAGLVACRSLGALGVLVALAGSAAAWNTDVCPVTNPQGGGDCTCVSAGVQTSGNHLPIGCASEFQPGASIGTWQSVNQPPAGTRTWTFDYGYMATGKSGWQAQFDVNKTVMNVTAGSNFWNVWDDKFASHPGGRYRVQVYFDGVAVAGGYREFAVCGSDFERACSGGDLYWYDACGDKRGKAEDCGAGSCSGGQCQCSQTAGAVCSGGDVYFTDCDGSVTSKKQDCGAGSCSGGQCQCSQTAGAVCSGGDVYFTDCDGSVTSKKQDCGAGSCSGGQCSCEAKVAKACHLGDVWWTDCDSVPSSLAQACEFGPCSGGACPGCAAQASVGCHQGDLWDLDCEGKPSGKKQDCGAGSCEAGACVCDPAVDTVCEGAAVWFVDCEGELSSPASSCLYGCVDGACANAPQPTAGFDPECLISDALFREVATMSPAAVQGFLDAHAGRLREADLGQQFAFSYPGTVDYSTVLGNGELGRDSSPADVIYWSGVFAGGGQDVRINPRVLLATLQKEQGLIDSAAKATQQGLDWAMGYAVFEGTGPTPKYKGFFGQVLATAWQLDRDFEALKAGPQPPITVDGQAITPRNRATAVLYKYTPHLSAGELFWTLWTQYFGDSGPCGDPGSVDPPVTGPPGDDPIELHCTHAGPYSVLGWPFDADTWKVVPGSTAHKGDDLWADDWNTTLGGCDTEISQGPMWVHAVASGTVLFVGDANNGYGFQVIVRLASDPTYVVRYAHMQPNHLWQNGDAVVMGDIIGAVGNTGGNYCAHLHLVLYCGVDAGSSAESRLSNGRSPSSLSGGATKHATWFTLDSTLKPWLEVGGGFPDCTGAPDPTGEAFIGQTGDLSGCLGAGDSASRWFVGRAGEEVALDLRAVNDDGEPDWALASVVDGAGLGAPVIASQQDAGGHVLRVTLPHDGRYAVTLRASTGVPLRWRLFHDAVHDHEPDHHPNAPLAAPGTFETHAIDHPADHDLFLLGAVADQLDVRAEPIDATTALSLHLRVLRDGRLLPFDGTWYALDPHTRRIAGTAEPIYVELTGDPGLYTLEVTRPTAPTPDTGEAPDASPSDDASASADAGPTPTTASASSGCTGAPAGGHAPWLVLAMLLLALRRRGPVTRLPPRHPGA